MHFPDRLEIPEDVLEIAETLRAAGHEAWCVGGAIRDTLLGEANTDYDVATSATPEVVKKLFEHTVPVGERFGTVAVRTRRRHHEVTTFRKDVTTDGRHAVVEYGAFARRGSCPARLHGQRHRRMSRCGTNGGTCSVD